jgi:hypothetical protein
MTTERAERFQQLCEEAAAKLNTTPDSERSRHVASLRLMHEACTIRLIEGLPVDPGDLLKLSAAIEAFLPQIETPKVQIEIIDSVEGKCPRCGYQGADLKPLQRPTEPARTIDLKPAPSSTEPAPTAKAAKAPEPKPAPKPAFHPAQDFSKGAPLRNGNEAWRGHVGRGGSAYPDMGQYLIVRDK